MRDYESYLSETVRTIKPSGIRRFFDLANDMEDVISLGVGEPDFDTPWHIREAAIYSIESGKTHYTANQGLMLQAKTVFTIIVTLMMYRQEVSQAVVLHKTRTDGFISVLSMEYAVSIPISP